MPRPVQQAGQGGDDLGHGDRHCGTVDSGGTSASLPHQIPHSPSCRLLADRLIQHGCGQICDNNMAGKDRHNYGHKMTPGGLPASLPGRLTESTVWSKDRIWQGLDS